MCRGYCQSCATIHIRGGGWLCIGWINSCSKTQNYWCLGLRRSRRPISWLRLFYRTTLQRCWLIFCREYMGTCSGTDYDAAEREYSLFSGWIPKTGQFEWKLPSHWCVRAHKVPSKLDRKWDQIISVENYLQMNVHWIFQRNSAQIDPFCQTLHCWFLRCY